MLLRKLVCSNSRACHVAMAAVSLERLAVRSCCCLEMPALGVATELSHRRTVDDGLFALKPAAWSLLHDLETKKFVAQSNIGYCSVHDVTARHV